VNWNSTAIGKLRYFFFTVLVMIILAGITLLASDKVSIHLAINSCHNYFLDVLFTYFTLVGDGFFVAVTGILIAAILFPRYKWLPLWFGATLLMGSGALAQVLKRFVFDGALRPSAYLSEHSLYFVEGVQLHSIHSFPSGHTTAGFAFFGFASLFLAYNKPWLQVLFAICAGMVGYSRMYLSQHFLEDVMAGMLLGTGTFILLLLLSKKSLRVLNA